jgi:flagellin-specific chaperone FliS
MFTTDDDFEDNSLEVINLKRENEELKTKLIDLTFEMNYNKQTELLEFLRQLYESTCEEMTSTNTKKEILFSLKKSIEEFAKDNKISL